MRRDKSARSQRGSIAWPLAGWLFFAMLVVGILDSNKSSSILGAEHATEGHSSFAGYFVEVVDPSHDVQMPAFSALPKVVGFAARSATLSPKPMLVGFCLFLGSYCLLFVVGNRFTESRYGRLPYRKRYLWFFLLDGLGLWCGVTLMLLSAMVL
jgi:hypothetical protein